MVHLLSYWVCSPSAQLDGGASGYAISKLFYRMYEGMKTWRQGTQSVSYTI